MNDDTEDFDRPIHNWFELTYSSYLVLPRLMMDSMPAAWQRKMVALLEEAQDKLIIEPDYSNDYMVKLRKNGKFVKDPYIDYRRGKKLKLREKERSPN